MAKEKKTRKVSNGKRAVKYEKPYTINTSFEDFIKIVVTPKEDLNPEDFNCKKA